jgi:hypothetical protein
VAIAFRDSAGEHLEAGRCRTEIVYPSPALHFTNDSVSDGIFPENAAVRFQVPSDAKQCQSVSRTAINDRRLGETQTRGIHDAPLRWHAWEISFVHPQSGERVTF